MLHDAVAQPGAVSLDELRVAYEDKIRDAVATAGADAAADAAGVSEDLLSNGVLELTLEQAASILALTDDYPDADAIVWEFRDHLLMGMTSGILDVDTLASEVDIDRSGQEIQQAIEGRTAATLDELAAIHHVIAVRNER
ncbi:hypothetical protein E6P09_06600 [Haloferax mediterranei ATCC 33500]|uniref:Uncharacterized protein n=1 Tax=Haloferax mediterranei (strain ATCC 33500 / DSM 1411 / JCM 8866 / NBRC 14739 / NCIMB 2177 / R-4) TaxID=523841 RepID=I3R2H4_HALMT|nr:DUF5791 family protein [Haloferax mediterranei]AFK18434.2 hypothetical protein HFX_0711 [Haloferax mediterranei ATCC 33500]AHZ22176.1 hypothetical protein BM92_05675 [Haloferax mediterranei ATCC 33500]EMA02289.1 hypothetical protein C439_06900 [Haloferax mediterranei ATCC 33500]MDX5988527.1 DUF5791 family protein [Haloferax mediterranei ATCC 33500]QCQ74943.1 hypothetical protein E6P09_06600 [Haloferax mediterranei ATCC 33500]